MTQDKIDRLYELCDKIHGKSTEERDEYERLTEQYYEEQEALEEDRNRGRALSEAYGPETIWDVHGRL